MGGGDGQGGIFTWREKNSRKVRTVTDDHRYALTTSCRIRVRLPAGILSVRASVFHLSPHCVSTQLRVAAVVPTPTVSDWTASLHASRGVAYNSPDSVA